MPSKRKAPTRSKSTSLKGDLTLLSGDQQSLTQSQVELLQAIDACGSITAAAKAVGISYKTAWDRIDSMNNLSDQALVARSAGGSKGGGTRLTEQGRKIVAGFVALQQEHADFVAQLGNKMLGMGDVASFMASNTLRSSARNQYRGRVSHLTRGGVNSEVTVQISNSVELVAIITNDSRKEMALKKGSEVIALVKSSWILLSTDSGIKTSARNQLVGTVSKISKGEVNSEIILDLGDGKTLCAVVTNPSVRELKLKKGVAACALFKASSVILMRA
jgi:molybdate transport system regulatory protein